MANISRWPLVDGQCGKLVQIFINLFIYLLFTTMTFLKATWCSSIEGLVQQANPTFCIFGSESLAGRAVAWWECQEYAFYQKCGILMEVSIIFPTLQDQNSVRLCTWPQVLLVTDGNFNWFFLLRSRIKSMPKDFFSGEKNQQVREDK